MTGVVHGTTQWLFAYPGPALRHHQQRRRADADAARGTGAQSLGRGGARSPACPTALPPWQVVRERRATIAADPRTERLRPPAKTAWDNLFLAGDWTDTGLPPTIESAIRSGERAAQLAAA